ncbi:GNAT family N-acetyltransferase [Fictibacillus terranigra]|uniref:GNAT family N-acetyltransferase n=1 Tax=Fictibacillus terranigra TaxID=3058424 RepID=A0ABT8E2E0_9BACL|nr:GNAT family N-acetyltransferase [Fictibacillus sp. CENA-BCM004]MDN4072055.1 GNAT family N-acetyltransferase [Fictibacillus sp. CENA-BCM004]
MLSEKQLSQIKKLQQQCESFENLRLKLNWDMLEQRTDERKEDFFHYEAGELAAFIGLYGFGNKVEMCGMVFPAHRRKGIFTSLFKEAAEAVKFQRYEQILLNAPSTSHTAKGYLKKVPCRFAFSEHQMRWQEGPIQLEEGVTLRQSRPEDFAFEVQIDVDCFGFHPDKAHEYNQSIKNDDRQQFYIIENNGKAAGKVRVAADSGEAWIYGFAVAPSEQGKGIGRKMLKTIIADQHQQGNSVFLEVEAKNNHALKLYEACGFKVYYTQDYYRLSNG